MQIAKLQARDIIAFISLIGIFTIHLLTQHEEWHTNALFIILIYYYGQKISDISKSPK